MSKTPSNPIYEKKQADWARRAIARKLGVKIIGMMKDAQWLPCKNHPSYQAIKPPTGGCPWCWRYWTFSQKAKV